MNKKIWIGCLLAVSMLVAISFVSSAEMNNDVEKKESPLYRIRTRRAISEKISMIIENIKTKFLGGKVFFIPFQFLLNRYNQYYYNGSPSDTYGEETCLGYMYCTQRSYGWGCVCPK